MCETRETETPRKRSKKSLSEWKLEKAGRQRRKFDSTFETLLIQNSITCSDSSARVRMFYVNLEGAALLPLHTKNPSKSNEENAFKELGIRFKLVCLFSLLFGSKRKETEINRV